MTAKPTAPLGLDPALVKKLSRWHRQLLREAELSYEETEVSLMLAQLARVREAIELITASLKAPSPAAGQAIKDATNMLLDLTGGLHSEGDLFGSLHTLGWAIESEGSARKYLADGEEFQARIDAQRANRPQPN